MPFEHETYKTIIITGFILSLLLNFLLLPMAIKSTKYTLGTYKIIMLLFSTTNTLYYILLLPQPIDYFKPYLIVLYVPGSEDWFNDILLDLAIQAYVIVYMMTVFLETLHFVYRYILLCRFEWQSFLTTGNLWKFFLIAYPGYIVFHSLNFSMLTRMDGDTSYALPASFNGKRIHAITFLFVDYKTGQLRWKSLVASLIFVLNSGILIGTMIFCGIKIHSRMKTLTRSTSSISIETHKTLFHMIMIQTIIPFFTLHLPAAATFLVPIFTNFEGETDLILISTMLYPIVEPLIVIFFLLKGQIKRALRKQHHSVAVPSVSAFRT